MDNLSTYECRKCHVTKPYEDFPRDRSRPSGIYPYCKPCNVAHVAKYRADNPGKVRDQQHANNNAQRAWYERIRSRSLEIYGGCCTACGGTERLDLDHVNEDGNEHRTMEHAQSMYARIARSGDRLEDYELQLLCRRCHNAKSHRNRRMAA